ncbi:hypothetical protein KY487_25030 [Ralstonia pseudosolanacearum]|uniref:hypothetical protein n=1 Tax=Ralstonia pseudosolanacearum TaxID=1310165 RepID=UPI001C8BB350|nr:hypothetical protein [Ralstonia pseudosolanacearum]MBX9432492.1 hypothetical protein [Ralstonia pseudosolanacearum]
MQLETQNKPVIAAPTANQIRMRIRSLKSYGPSSYASLADTAGSYVQVAGGGITCMVERFDAETEARFRAFHGHPNPVYPDGTILSFGAGSIPMKSDEWFASDQVSDIFIAFLTGSPFPGGIRWRAASGF